ncbi:MAG: uracil-DNA glycosylase [Spirochaetes bacterium]|uniref:Uracil-DNA glycosylase n=1 Tax=Candidatus Ornithospirochaeta stercoravium TaxID=2840897 RepID=A0A9D9NDZ5_9SPIO|nr:uracil-DNA glycosylase [Candidatus Ornithospirochaeta stercoravium]
MIHVGNDWQPLFDIEQEKPYYLELRSFLKNEYRTKTVFPPMNEIFNAFMLTSFSDTRVVIVGQDPYHEKDQAMGLSFSVREGVEEPPSLKNIHQEIIAEGVEQGLWSSDLTRWAKQGVLLLNSTLTVVEHQAAAHSGKGWEIFTDNAIRALGEDDEPRVFILWGSYARSKKSLITNPSHLILESAHPSPLSAYRGFFGNNHFRLCNEFLKAHGYPPIYW